MNRLQAHIKPGKRKKRTAIRGVKRVCASMLLHKLREVCAYGEICPCVP